MQSLRIIVRRLGGPEVLETVRKETPEPSRGEVRVREFVAGVSFADLLMRRAFIRKKRPSRLRRDGTSWVSWTRPERECRKS